MVARLTEELHANEDQVRDLARERSSLMWLPLRCGCKLHVEVLRHCAARADDSHCALCCPHCGSALDGALVRHCFPGPDPMDPLKTLHCDPDARTDRFIEGDHAVPLLVYSRVEARICADMRHLRVFDSCEQWLREANDAFYNLPGACSYDWQSASQPEARFHLASALEYCFLWTESSGDADEWIRGTHLQYGSEWLRDEGFRARVRLEMINYLRACFYGSDRALRIRTPVQAVIVQWCHECSDLASARIADLVASRSRVVDLDRVRAAIAAATRPLPEHRAADADILFRENRALQAPVYLQLSRGKMDAPRLLHPAGWFADASSSEEQGSGALDISVPAPMPGQVRRLTDGRTAPTTSTAPQRR